MMYVVWMGKDASVDKQEGVADGCVKDGVVGEVGVIGGSESEYARDGVGGGESGA